MGVKQTVVATGTPWYARGDVERIACQVVKDAACLLDDNGSSADIPRMRACGNVKQRESGTEDSKMSQSCK